MQISTLTGMVNRILFLMTSDVPFECLENYDEALKIAWAAKACSIGKFCNESTRAKVIVNRPSHVG